MTWFKKISLTGLALMLLMAPTVSAQDTQDFYFESFSGEYYLDRDEKQVATLRVVETLVAVFPEIDQNHGIERAIPKSYNGADLDIRINSVTNDSGEDWNFTTSDDGSGNLVIRIGDSDKFVHGRQSYVIDYNLRSVITFFDSDELYWDINGDDWLQTISSVSATVYIPNYLASELQLGEYCYSGSFGEDDDRCHIERLVGEDEVQINSSVTGIGPYQTLTIAIAFETGTFKVDTWPAKRDEINACVALAISLAAAIYSYRRWRKYGRDPEGKGVIPQYAPSTDLSVMAAHTLVEEKFKSSSISAGIIELAVSGFIKIYENDKGKKTEYELELIKLPTGLYEEQKLLVNGLFGTNAEVGSKKNISDEKYKLASTATKISAYLPKTLAKLGYFKQTPGWAIGKQVLYGLLVLIIGIVSLVVGGNYWGLGVGLIIASVIVVAMSAVMPVKTPKGVEAKEYILGLKDYIALAEKDRIKFLQSPEGVKQYGDPTSDKAKLNLFEALLPYAMIFGMEKAWAKQFQDLYTQPPEWYGGSHMFIPVSFGNSINSLSKVSSTAFSPPRSSGSSGFGGGGFSGGGGGGGGGGGW